MGYPNNKKCSFVRMRLLFGLVNKDFLGRFQSFTVGGTKAMVLKNLTTYLLLKHHIE